MGGLSLLGEEPGRWPRCLLLPLLYLRCQGLLRLAGFDVALLRVVQKALVAGDEGQLVDSRRCRKDAVGRVSVEVARQAGGFNEDGSG